VLSGADVVFAADSIPAIFGITTDPFIVITAEVFACLGLLSLYFVISRMMTKFRYLQMGLAFVLIIIGVKMVVSAGSTVIGSSFRPGRPWSSLQ